MWSAEYPIPVTLLPQRLDSGDDCQSLIEPRPNPFANLLDYGIGNWRLRIGYTVHGLRIMGDNRGFVAISTLFYT